jgi:hypothetical protein
VAVTYDVWQSWRARDAALRAEELDQRKWNNVDEAGICVDVIVLQGHHAGRRVLLLAAKQGEELGHERHG